MKSPAKESAAREKWVEAVNVPGKRKRVRMKYGYASDWKKAIVTLKEGSKIEVA